MIGFTPELAVAVWVGYDQGRPIRSTESHLATPIFAEFVERALAAVPPKIFEIRRRKMAVRTSTSKKDAVRL
jgi:membrane carboxypeptidase/penicillin-binding protein